MPSDSESSSSLSSVGMSEFRLPHLTPCTHCHRALLDVCVYDAFVKSLIRLPTQMDSDNACWTAWQIYLKAEPCSPGLVPVENVLWGWLSSKWLGCFLVPEIPIMPSACLGLLGSNMALRRRGQQKGLFTVSCELMTPNKANIHINFISRHMLIF